jgi:Lar family restriction alleviation protein
MLPLNRFKQCPFCGKEAALIRTESDDETDTEIWDIACRTEGCYLEFGASWFYPVEKIIEMWNRRI